MPGVFDYYYGEESESCSFYRIPRLLIVGERFSGLSTDAKLLYGLMLDRMNLSARNGWYDDAGRVYIYYTLEEIQESMSCGHGKAVRLLAELDTGKGSALSSEPSRGRVSRRASMSSAIPHGRYPRRPLYRLTSQIRKSRLPKMGSQEFPKTEVQTSQKGTRIIKI